MLSKITGKKIFIYLLVLVLIILGLRACTKEKNTKFPEISNNSYLGELAIDGKTRPFFISRHNTEYLIALVESKNTPKLSKLPNVELNGKVYLLVGKKINKKIEGEVLLETKQVGTWSLKKIDEQSFPVSMDLIENIKNYYLLRYEAKALREESTDYASRIENYKNAIPKEEKIKNIALNEVDDLKFSIEEKKEIKKQLSKETKNKVIELEQLQRITTYGRVVDLARRTTKREDRWYLANWGEGSIEESQQEIADSLGIDLNILDEKLKLADEYTNLKNSINAEARRIEQLKTPKQKPKEADLEVIKPVETQKKKDKTFWNSMGDIFGL